MREKDEYSSEEQIYEIGFHILPTVPEEKLPEAVLKLKDLITQSGGTVLAEDFPKMKILAYEIKKRIEAKYLSFNKAYFGWIKFEVPHVSIDKIEKEIKNNSDILRFIIVRTVRENTMHTPKPPTMIRGNNLEGVETSPDQSVPAEKIEISEAEMDKSIDELLIN